MFWETKNLKELDLLNEKIARLEEYKKVNDEKMRDITFKIDKLLAEKPSALTKEEKESLAELQVQSVKLWGLLTEKTPTGKDRLSKHGKRIRGRI